MINPFTIRKKGRPGIPDTVISPSSPLSTSSTVNQSHDFIQEICKFKIVFVPLGHTKKTSLHENFGTLIWNVTPALRIRNLGRCPPSTYIPPVKNMIQFRHSKTSLHGPVPRRVPTSLTTRDTTKNEQGRDKTKFYKQSFLTEKYKYKTSILELFIITLWEDIYFIWIQSCNLLLI